MKVTVLFSGVVLGALAQVSLHAATLGTAITLHGRLNDNGSPANRSYDFRFVLYDAATGGNAVSLPALKEDVPVNSGLFFTEIDFGAGMFAGDARWLEMAIRPSNSTGDFTVQNPRINLNASPYALFAPAAGVANTATTVNSVAWTSITGKPGGLDSGQFVRSLNNLSGDVTLTAGANVTLTRSGNSVQVSASGTIGSLTLPFDQTQSFPNNTLFRVNNPSNGTAITGDTTAGWGVFGRTQTGLGVFGQATGNSAGVLGRSEGTEGEGVYGYASQSAVGVLGVSEGNDGVSGRSNAERKSGVFGYSEKNTGYGGFFRNAANGVGVSGSSEGGTAVEGFSNNGWGIWGRSQSNVGAFGQTLGADAAGVLGRNEANTGKGQAVFGYASQSAVGVLGVSEGNDGISGRSNAEGKSGVFGYTERGTGWGGFFVNTAPGGTALQAQGKAFISEQLSCKVLEIRGGMDLAEPFAMSEPNNAPGTVMVIDDEHPGQLRRSSRAYDTRVAGVISGAGGINAGITLRQDSASDRGQVVALTGRVYVQADASHGAIKPGDLLTTSDTPGHAMKVADHPHAQGAILGKAMTGLKEGKGLVLVLVTLQ